MVRISLMSFGCLFFIATLSRSSKLQTIMDYTHDKVSVQCDLCADNWLFIISTGRSGSTSVFTMLNLVPGWSKYNILYLYRNISDVSCICIAFSDMGKYLLQVYSCQGRMTVW